MYDTQIPPTGCFTASMSLCFVNADTTGSGGFPEPNRRLCADDWLALDASPLTHVKVWSRINTAGWEYYQTGPSPNPGAVHGWCVSIWEANMNPDVVCPDGTVAGDAGLGTLVYADKYSSNFTTEVVTGGITRHMAYCITLPEAFYPVTDKWYWISVAMDFDCIYYTGGPSAAYYTFSYWRFWPGLGISVCEAANKDGWNPSPADYWNGVSATAGSECLAGWDMGFVLYSGEIPVAVEPTTWGKIKANYR